MFNRNDKGKKKNITLILAVIAIILVSVNLFAFFHLFNDKDNNKATDSNQETQELGEGFEIETKYCDLYFPKLFEQQIEIKYIEDGGYKIEFYGLINEKEAKHIFDVCFNSDNGFLLGFLEKEGEIINISIDVKELTFDEGWTQEEMNQIYTMQEEVNYLMDSLKKIDYYVEP